MKNSPGSRPHSCLSAEARALWRQLAKDYGLTDAAGQSILRVGLEAHDRMRECQQAIAKDGALLVDRFGQQKPHPLLAAERDARGQFLGAMRQLNFDVEPLRDGPGRPGGGRAR